MSKRNVEVKPGETLRGECELDAEKREVTVKYSYLTDEEAGMSREAVNMQVILGLQTCKTKGDVEALLNDIRKHERGIILGKGVVLPDCLVEGKPPVCPDCNKPMRLYTKFVNADIWYRCPHCLRVDSQQFTFGDRDINK